MERLINKICNTRCAGRLRGKAKHFLMSQLFRKAMFKSSLSKIQRSTPPTSFQFFQIKKPVCKVWKRKKQVNELAWQVQIILYHSALHNSYIHGMWGLIYCQYYLKTRFFNSITTFQYSSFFNRFLNILFQKLKKEC